MSVPSTAGAEVGEELGPWIGNSQYRTTAEFSDAVAGKYQQLYDQGYSLTMQDVALGLVPNDPLVIGGKVDTFARLG